MSKMPYTGENINFDRYESLEAMVANDRLVNLLHLQKTRVLLIEDDRTTRRIVSRSIGPYCNLTEATNAGQGISKFINFAPDIVFLDLELPDRDGHQILKWMMHNDPGAYVILFTGNCDTYNIHKASKNGAKGYIPKPFDKHLMMFHIRKCPKLH